MKTLVALSVAGLAISGYGQAFIALDNYSNTDTSWLATSNGLFWIGPWDWCPAFAPFLLNQDINAAFYGGADSSNLSLIASFSGSAAAGVNWFGPGIWTDPTGGTYSVPGTTCDSTSAWFRIQVWMGTFNSYADAISGGAPTAQSPVFVNPVACPPSLPPDLTGMPAVVIVETCTIQPVEISISFDPAAGVIRLSFPAKNARYQIQASTNLITWTNVSQIYGNGATQNVTYPVDRQGQTFYRTKVLP